jgi:pterin-4a-carbinolamine dehydratase
MTRHWSPGGGVLTPAEVGRALETRPGWERWPDRLVRELRCRDFVSARRLAERLADEATYYGRHPQIVIHDDGRMSISVAGPNHAGLTVADLTLADDVDRVIEAERG